MGNINDVSILDGIDFSKTDGAEAASTSETTEAPTVADTTEAEVKSDSDTAVPAVEGEEATNEEE
jgi:hypothetical protein